MTVGPKAEEIRLPARFQDLCLDVVGDGDGKVPSPTASFWAAMLGLTVSGDGQDIDRLTGPTPAHTVWLNAVPEAHTVKNRVHLDLHSPVEVPPGTRRLSEPGEFDWTVVAGPDGDECCIFVRDRDDDALWDYRLYGVTVDAQDPAAVARWWQRVMGGRVRADPSGCVELCEVPGLPFDGIVFAAVPERKTVKNRVHWDVTLQAGSDADDLVSLGAVVLRRPDQHVQWTVLADPEGNEFCAFEPAAEPNRPETGDG